VKKILVIEDEKDFSDLLVLNLESEGFTVLCSYDGLSGLKKAQHEKPDLILLDLILPELMGMEICKELRKESCTSHIPVMMMTAKGAELDRVAGFEAGADDYLVKPFSMRELLLRIRAIIKRCEVHTQPQPSKQITIGGITIETLRNRVLNAGVEVDLTSTEYKLLLCLLERPGRALSREMILKNAWDNYNKTGDSRTVDTHITRLRGKLGGAGDMIKTVRGFGYKTD